MILICYIFSTNKVLEIRLVVLIPLTTIQKFNWQLCLKLTDPNFAWFNSQSTKKVPTLGLAFSYLRTPVLSVFYDLSTLLLSSCIWQYFFWIYIRIYSFSYFFGSSKFYYFYNLQTDILIKDLVIIYCITSRASL